MALVAFILVIVGLLNIFGRDFIWWFTRIGHDLNGVYARRTPTWDRGRIVLGTIMAMVGVVMLIREALIALF
jgi:hypothetical protein